MQATALLLLPLLLLPLLLLPLLLICCDAQAAAVVGGLCHPRGETPHYAAL